MSALNLRVVEQTGPVSGVHARPVSRSAEVRQRFVENWGRLAATFGMDRDLGRVHAQLFIADEAVDAETIANELDLDLEAVGTHLGSLIEWGVVRVGSNGIPETYATSRDPWDFFLEIMRQRHRREFMPVLELVRETALLARQLGHGDAATRARVEAFSKFVEDLSGLLDVFVRVGSKPMALVLKTFAKMAPRA
jgi:DNA-binding transcriptional regulator GbsR (MarR family)